MIIIFIIIKSIITLNRYLTLRTLSLRTDRTAHPRSRDPCHACVRYYYYYCYYYH